MGIRLRIGDDRLDKLRTEAQEAYSSDKPLEWDTGTILEVCEHAHTMNLFRVKWRNLYEDAIDRGGFPVHVIWFGHFEVCSFFPFDTVADLKKRSAANVPGYLRSRGVVSAEVRDHRGCLLADDILLIDLPEVEPEYPYNMQVSEEFQGKRYRRVVVTLPVGHGS